MLFISSIICTTQVNNTLWDALIGWYGGERSAVSMRIRCAFVCSLQIFLFLMVLCSGNLLHLKKFLTKVSCLSLWANGKCLAPCEVSNLCYALVKDFGLCSHLGFKLVSKCKKHFLSRRINSHCNSTASFQLDNVVLCGDVHPNPGYGNTSDTAEVSTGRKPPTWKHQCVICSKPVHSNQKGILCVGCCNQHHTECIGMNNRTAWC